LKRRSSACPIHRCDADEFKVQDAGAVENHFLKHVRYNGKIEQIYEVFHRKMRVVLGKNEDSSVGIIDSELQKRRKKEV
jgi:hypothetical protein